MENNIAVNNIAVNIIDSNYVEFTNNDFTTHAVRKAAEAYLSASGRAGTVTTALTGRHGGAYINGAAAYITFT